MVSSAGRTKKLNQKRSKLSLLATVGFVFIFLALLIFGFTFYSIISQEIHYRFSVGKQQPVDSVKPVNSQFGIIIPKIQANASVIANVDPFNPQVYQQSLTRGVAHAQNSSLPDQPGNMFIFSHSSANFYQATRYNSIFYLLHKLVPGDQIIIYYQDNPYYYQVVSKQYVQPQAVEYLRSFSPQHTLTLMTCWPPGTTLKRLIIQANLQPE